MRVGAIMRNKEREIRVDIIIIRKERNGVGAIMKKRKENRC
jgi:hypothetical protein